MHCLKCISFFFSLFVKWWFTHGKQFEKQIVEYFSGRSQGASADVTLNTGDKIKITTDDKFKEKCSKDTLWVDYKNITKVMSVGARMFIDDGLISIIVKEMGQFLGRHHSKLWSVTCLPSLLHEIKWPSSERLRSNYYTWWLFFLDYKATLHFCFEFPKHKETVFSIKTLY